MRRVRSYSAGSNDDPYVPPIKDHAEGVKSEGDICGAGSSEKDFLSRNWEGEGIGEGEEAFGELFM